MLCKLPGNRTDYRPAAVFLMEPALSACLTLKRPAAVQYYSSFPPLGPATLSRKSPYQADFSVPLANS
jgi:hypothetical protein